MVLLEALEDWNPWWKNNIVDQSLKGIERDALSDAVKFLDLNKVKVLTGVRRAGKSTFLYQIIDHLLKRVRPEDIVLINFDDVRFSTVDLEEIVKKYIESKKPTKLNLFLDEIHNARNWVSYVRKLIDTKKGNVFITDSCSYYIPVDYAKLLTGRKISIELYPLSFKEYLRFKNLSSDFHGTEERARIRGYLRDYIRSGGFPETVFLGQSISKRILVEYFDDIITKDVVSRYGVDYTKVKDLAFYLISNVGQRITLRKLRNIFNIGIETAKKYLSYLETVYMLFTVKCFSGKVKEQIIMPRKIYAVDTGLMNAVGFRISESFGSVLENIVFLELKRRGLEIYYGLIDNKEVDFIVRERMNITDIINVSYDPLEHKTRKREVDAMKQALKKFRRKKGLILTWDYRDKINIGNKEIIFKPIYEWLLGY